MPKYRIRVRSSPGWQKHRSATLGVSVLSENWCGEKFAAILAFAEEKFDLIRIDVTDALYRHNFMAGGLAPEQAFARAQSAGDQWLKQHEAKILGCRVETSIIRWAEWYSHPDYPEVLSAFRDLHDSDSRLQTAIETDVVAFYNRKNQTPSSLELKHGANFMIEEIAVISLQSRALASLKIYPGYELQCLKLVRSGLLERAPKGLEREQYARIQFERG